MINTALPYDLEDLPPLALLAALRGAIDGCSPDGFRMIKKPNKTADIDRLLGGE